MQRVSQAPKAGGWVCPLGPFRIGSQSQKGAGPGCRRHSPSILLMPRGLLRLLCALLCPADSTVHPSGACLLPLAREESTTSLKPGQKSGGGQHGPTVGQGEPDKAGEPVCALEAALPEQRPSCSKVTEQRGRFPDRSPGHLPQAQSPEGADSRPTPSSQERVKRK